MRGWRLGEMNESGRLRGRFVRPAHNPGEMTGGLNHYPGEMTRGVELPTG